MTDAESELHTGSGSCAAIRANLTRANLTGAYLYGAIADEDTTWPKGFDPVAAGVIFD